MSFYIVTPPLFQSDLPPPSKSGAIFYHCIKSLCYTVWGVAWGDDKFQLVWSSLAEY